MTDVFAAKVMKFSPRMQADVGIKGFQADGVFGNLGEETAGFSELQEEHPVVAGSRGGFGWPQWTGSRRVAYEQWCTVNKLDPSDDEANYGFLKHELLTTFLHCLQALRATRTRDDAVRVFEQLYEIAGVAAINVRILWAKRAEAARLQAEGSKPMSDTSGVTTATAGVGDAVAPVDKIAAFIKQEELQAEDVLKAFLVAKGVPAFAIDFVFSEVNSVDLVPLAEKYGPALLSRIFTQAKAA